MLLQLSASGNDQLTPENDETIWNSPPVALDEFHIRRRSAQMSAILYPSLWWCRPCLATVQNHCYFRSPSWSQRSLNVMSSHNMQPLIVTLRLFTFDAANRPCLAFRAAGITWSQVPAVLLFSRSLFLVVMSPSLSDLRFVFWSVLSSISQPAPSSSDHRGAPPWRCSGSNCSVMVRGLYRTLSGLTRLFWMRSIRLLQSGGLSIILCRPVWHDFCTIWLWVCVNKNN